MPIKIRELESMLKKSGCTWVPGKGSHRRYSHSAVPDMSVTISGQRGDDVKIYQVREVEKFIQAIKRATKSK